jgi:DNA primase
VAPLGTAFTGEQAKLLSRFAQRVVVFFDGDSAGRKATLAARESCREAGLSARVVNVAEGKDPDDLVRSRGAAHVTELVKGARGMLEFLLESMLDASFSQADVYERAHRVDRVAKLLTEENDPVVRSMAKSYADQLAGRLDLGVRSNEAFRALEQQVKRAFAQATHQERGPLPREARIKPRDPGSAERAEIVGALIEFPELLDDDAVASHLDLLEGAAVTALSALRRSTFVAPNGSKSLDSQLFLQQIPDSLRPFASARLAAPEHETEKEARETLINNLTKLRKLMLSREHHAISREAHAAEGDFERTIELARDAQTRVRLLQGIKDSD